jgi:hypothetical protein
MWRNLYFRRFAFATIVAIAAMLLVPSSQAEGNIITYQFSGTVTSSNLTAMGSFRPGDSIVGRFAYDDAASVKNSGAYGKDYSQPASPSNFQIDDTTHPLPLPSPLSDWGTTDSFSVYAPNHNDKSFSFSATLSDYPYLEDIRANLLFMTPGSGNYASFSLSEIAQFLATNPTYKNLDLTGLGECYININEFHGVPEPSTIALLAAALGLLAYAWHRRK